MIGFVRMPYSKHRVTPYYPKKNLRKKYDRIVDQEQLVLVSIDAARYPGGYTPELLRLRPSATESDVSEILLTRKSVVTQGTRTSLTGGATPQGSTVLDMSKRDKILELGNDWVKVQSGITLEKLQRLLRRRKRYYPPGPTYEGATVGGMIATNAAGPATFKYGQTRRWVKGIKVVLATGEVLDLERGRYTAHKNGHFELIRNGEQSQKIPIPKYPMPKVAKISAGYFSKPEMDLIDLFIGSEGTLGVITEATLYTIPRPEIHWVLVECKTDQEAHTVSSHLRNISLKEWKKGKTLGTSVCAIEYIDTESLELLRIDGLIDSSFGLHSETTTLLIIQVETATKRTTDLTSFINEMKRLGVSDRSHVAYSKDTKRIRTFKKLREGVPLGVNRRVNENKMKNDRAITKMAADMVVPFELLPKMMQLFREAFDTHNLKHYTWGHFSDGNVHPNVVASSYKEVVFAKKIILQCGHEVIKMGGSPLAEHGVGRNEIKQELLRSMYEKYNGIEQMRVVKEALDPEWKLAPGNLFQRWDKPV